MCLVINYVCVLFSLVVCAVYSMASTVIQIYLKHILEAYFSPQNLLRMTVLQVISLVLKQGLVHPVQVSYGVGKLCDVSQSMIQCMLVSQCNFFIVVNHSEVIQCCNGSFCLLVAVCSLPDQHEFRL